MTADNKTRRSLALAILTSLTLLVASLLAKEQVTDGNPNPAGAPSRGVATKPPELRCRMSKDLSACDNIITPDVSCRPSQDGAYHASRCSSIHPLDQACQLCYQLPRWPAWLFNYLTPRSA